MNLNYFRCTNNSEIVEEEHVLETFNPSDAFIMEENNANDERLAANKYFQ